MTEGDWLACTEPDSLLWLPLLRGKISSRKLRLFACACVRRLWHLLTDERCRAVVELVESYADGVATQEELRAARALALAAVTSPVIACPTTLGEAFRVSPGSVASMAAATPPRFSPRPTALWAAGIAGQVADDRVAFDTERNEQAALFRDLIGNPFRPVRIDASWLTWDSGTAVRLARAIYEERSWDEMGVLGDALQEAGCADEEILSHCRGPGLHARGCFVVDGLLGLS